jgi:adenylate cyclase
LLLEGCLRSGDANGGLAVTEWALPEIEGVRLWEAEIHRLRAEFLAALAAPSEQVEAELQQALEVARRQGARAFELRAVERLQPKERLLER